MNKKLLYFLIAGICISLLGIIIVQFFWIRNAFQVNESQFDRGVNDALGSAVNKMEVRENMYFISRNFEGDSIMSIVQAFTKDTTHIIKDRLDSLLASNELEPCLKKQCPGNQSQPAPYTPAQGVVHYAYQYNIVPIQENNDSISLKIEHYYQQTTSKNISEFNFEWNDQLALIDSMFESRNEFFRFSGEIPADVQIANMEGEVIVENPDPHGPRFIRYHMPQMMDPSIIYPRPPRLVKKKEIKENSIQKL
ncbi:MAG: hypothetical protein WCI71_19135, partial [Bacteroidota bacterium]